MNRINGHFTRIFFAPDNIPTGGSGLEVPVVAAPERPAAQEVKVPVHEGATKVAETLGLVPAIKIKGPKELLGESPEESMAEFNKPPEKAAERDPVTGKFKPKEGSEKAPEKKKPDAKKPDAAKPGEKPAETDTTPRFKVGDKLMTQAELDQHLAELEKKAKPAEEVKPIEKKAKPAEEVKPIEETPEAKAEAEQKRYKEFVEKRQTELDLKEFGIELTEEAHDIILSGGPKAIAAHLDMLKKLAVGIEMGYRQFFASQANPLFAQLEPLIRDRQQIEQFRNENSFLGANPDIKDHPKGVETYRTVAGELHKYYSDLQQKAASGKLSPVEHAWATIYENQTREEFDADVAHHTRERLKAIPAAAAPAAAAPAVVPAAEKPAATVKPKPAPAKPFGGERPGGASATPSTKSDQSKFVEDLTNAGH